MKCWNKSVTFKYRNVHVRLNKCIILLNYLKINQSNPYRQKIVWSDEINSRMISSKTNPTFGCTCIRICMSDPILRWSDTHHLIRYYIRQTDLIIQIWLLSDCRINIITYFDQVNGPINKHCYHTTRQLIPYWINWINSQTFLIQQLDQMINIW